MPTTPSKSKTERDAEEKLAVSISDFIEAAARVVRAGKKLVNARDAGGPESKLNKRRKATANR